MHAIQSACTLSGASRRTSAYGHSQGESHAIAVSRLYLATHNALPPTLSSTNSSTRLIITHIYIYYRSSGLALKAGTGHGVQALVASLHTVAGKRLAEGQEREAEAAAVGKVCASCVLPVCLQCAMRWPVLTQRVGAGGGGGGHERGRQAQAAHQGAHACAHNCTRSTH